MQTLFFGQWFTVEVPLPDINISKARWCIQANYWRTRLSNSHKIWIIPKQSKPRSMSSSIWPRGYARIAAFIVSWILALIENAMLPSQITQMHNNQGTGWKEKSTMTSWRQQTESDFTSMMGDLREKKTLFSRCDLLQQPARRGTTTPDGFHFRNLRGVYLKGSKWVPFHLYFKCFFHSCVVAVLSGMIIKQKSKHVATNICTSRAVLVFNQAWKSGDVNSIRGAQWGGTLTECYTKWHAEWEWEGMSGESCNGKTIHTNCMEGKWREKKRNSTLTPHLCVKGKNTQLL